MRCRRNDISTLCERWLTGWSADRPVLSGRTPLMTQGQIERYHRSTKNVVKLEKYYSPW